MSLRVRFALTFVENNQRRSVLSVFPFYFLSPSRKRDGGGIFEELKRGVSEMLSKLPNYCTVHSEPCDFEIPGAPSWNDVKPMFEKALKKSTGVKWVFWNKPKPTPRVCVNFPPSATCAQIEASLIISERPAAVKAAKEVEGVSSLMAELEAVDGDKPANAKPAAPKRTTVHAKLKEFNLASVTNIKCSAGLTMRRKKLEPCHSAGEQEFLEMAKSHTINIVEDISMKDIGRTKSTSAIEEIILTGPEVRYSTNSVERSMINAMEKMKACRVEDHRPQQRYKQCSSAGSKAHGKVKSPERMLIDSTPDENPVGSWVVL